MLVEPRWEERLAFLPVTSPDEYTIERRPIDRGGSVEVSTTHACIEDEATGATYVVRLAPQ